MTKRLVTVGDLVVDLLLDARLPLQAGQHQTLKRLQFEAGGACTTVLAARNMGLDVAVLGAVGDDRPGQMLLDILTEAAVDTSALVFPDRSTTTTVLALTDTESCEHVFLGHYGVGDDIGFTEQAQRLLGRADAIFMPGYTLVEARLTGLVDGVLDWLARHEGRLYFDVGPFTSKLSPAQVNRVLALTDTLLLTYDEIPFATAGASGLAAIHKLLRRFPALTVALKLADAGCRVFTGADEIHCPGFAVDVVDTVGAGDAFAGAYIWADLQRYSPLECGTIANAMGAASVGRAGAGTNAPTRADVQALLDRRNAGINLSC